MDQVYSNTQVSTQVNTDQHEATQAQRESTPVNTIPTRVNTNQHDKSTRDNTSLKRVNTSRHKSTRINISQKVSQMSRHESARVWHKLTWVNWRLVFS